MTDPSIDRDCIEAETLAMWAEGSLPASQAAAVEAHVSDCARCQELVATFALTEPEAAASPAFVPARAPWLQRYWLPLAGGLVAATLFTAVVIHRESVAPPQTEALTAQVDAPATPPTAPRPEPDATPAPPAVAAPLKTPPAPAPARKRESAPKTTTPAAPAATTSAVPAAVPVLPPPPVPMPAPVTMAPRPAPQFPQPAVTGGMVGGAAGGVAGGVVGGVVGGIAAGATTAGRAGAIDLRAERAITASDEMQFARVVEFASPASVGGGGRGGSRITAAMTVAAPGAIVRWRVTTPTKVERSTDEGKTWTTVDLGAGPVAITNGAAPSRLTCWLVGKAGLVLRSADGVTFAHVTFPEALDLVSIVATDLVHATVTAIGGRRFATADGGSTWTERSP